MKQDKVQIKAFKLSLNSKLASVQACGPLISGFEQKPHQINHFLAFSNYFPSFFGLISHQLAWKEYLALEEGLSITG